MNWTRKLRQKEEREMLEADCTTCFHIKRGECEYDSVGLEDGEMYCDSYEKK